MAKQSKSGCENDPMVMSASHRPSRMVSSPCSHVPMDTVRFGFQAFVEERGHVGARFRVAAKTTARRGTGSVFDCSLPKVSPFPRARENEVHTGVAFWRNSSPSDVSEMP